MVAMSERESLGRRIGLEFGAERVILFGSYAGGKRRRKVTGQPWKY
jgi:hypothetical protein